MKRQIFPREKTKDKNKVPTYLMGMKPGLLAHRTLLKARFNHGLKDSQVQYIGSTIGSMVHRFNIWAQVQP